MRHTILLLCVFLIGSALARGEGWVRVLSITGSASVRHGAGELWAPLTAGEVLKPEDTIELGEGGSASLLLPEGRRIDVTEKLIVNISDLREVSQEDLLMLLAMEQIRIVPERTSPGGVPAPATTIHGSRAGGAVTPPNGASAAGLMELRGAEWLFGNGYFATSILRVKSTLRVYSNLPGSIDARLMAADAMEKTGVLEEALIEYRSLLGGGSALTPAQESLARRKVAELGKKN